MRRLGLSLVLVAAALALASLAGAAAAGAAAAAGGWEQSLPLAVPNVFAGGHGDGDGPRALLRLRALLKSDSDSDSGGKSSSKRQKPYDTCVCVFDFDETLRVISPDRRDHDYAARDGPGIIRKCKEHGWEVGIASANDNYPKLQKVLSQKVESAIFTPEFFASSAFQYHWFNKSISLDNIARYYDTVPHCMMLFDDMEHNRKYADALGVTFIKARNDTGIRWEDFTEGQKYLHDKCWCAKPQDRSYSNFSRAAADRNFTGKDRYGKPLPSNSSQNASDGGIGGRRGQAGGDRNRDNGKGSDSSGSGSIGGGGQVNSTPNDNDSGVVGAVGGAFESQTPNTAEEHLETVSDRDAMTAALSVPTPTPQMVWSQVNAIPAAAALPEAAAANAALPRDPAMAAATASDPTQAALRESMAAVPLVYDQAAAAAAAAQQVPASGSTQVQHMGMVTAAMPSATATAADSDATANAVHTATAATDPRVDGFLPAGTVAAGGVGGAPKRVVAAQGW